MPNTRAGNSAWCLTILATTYGSGKIALRNSGDSPAKVMVLILMRDGVPALSTGTKVKTCHTGWEKKNTTHGQTAGHMSIIAITNGTGKSALSNTGDSTAS